MECVLCAGLETSCNVALVNDLRTLTLDGLGSNRLSTLYDVVVCLLSIGSCDSKLNLIIENIANPNKYDLTKVSPEVRKVLESSKKSGRGTVPDSVESILYHEFGHALEKKVLSVYNAGDLINRMPMYAENVSGYATTSFSEYLAESFASYMSGESVSDPMLIDAINTFRREKK